VLSVVVGGELQVLESRLDEISDVFAADTIPLNLTLCDLSRLLGTRGSDGGGGPSQIEGQGGDLGGVFFPPRGGGGGGGEREARKRRRKR